MANSFVLPTRILACLRLLAFLLLFDCRRNEINPPVDAWSELGSVPDTPEDLGDLDTQPVDQRADVLAFDVELLDAPTPCVLINGVWTCHVEFDLGKGKCIPGVKVPFACTPELGCTEACPVSEFDPAPLPPDLTWTTSVCAQIPSITMNGETGNACFWPHEHLCMPCKSGTTYAFGKCVDLGSEGSFVATWCQVSGGADCPPGFVCEPDHVCVPVSGKCACPALGASTTTLCHPPGKPGCSVVRDCLNNNQLSPCDPAKCP